MKLSENIGESLAMLAKIDEISERLPMLDCGACGAPSCRALAEDIVRGYAKENDCVFQLRDHIHNLARSISSLEAFFPNTLRKENEVESNDK